MYTYVRAILVYVVFMYMCLVCAHTYIRMYVLCLCVPLGHSIVMQLKKLTSRSWVKPTEERGSSPQCGLSGLLHRVYKSCVCVPPICISVCTEWKVCSGHILWLLYLELMGAGKVWRIHVCSPPSRPTDHGPSSSVGLFVTCWSVPRASRRLVVCLPSLECSFSSLHSLQALAEQHQQCVWGYWKGAELAGGGVRSGGPVRAHLGAERASFEVCPSLGGCAPVWEGLSQFGWVCPSVGGSVPVWEVCPSVEGSVLVWEGLSQCRRLCSTGRVCLSVGGCVPVWEGRLECTNVRAYLCAYLVFLILTHLMLITEAQVCLCVQCSLLQWASLSSNLRRLLFAQLNGKSVLKPSPKPAGVELETALVPVPWKLWCYVHLYCILYNIICSYIQSNIYCI